jgi:hypothetical protein
MSDLLELTTGQYHAPEGVMDFGERTIDGKKLILYISDVAFVDIVQIETIEGSEVLGSHILTVESTPDRAMDLLNHTPLFLPPEEAERIFGRTKLADDDLKDTYGDSWAA